MNLAELIHMTRVYCRDNNSYMFTDSTITLFLNQAIDRIKQYKLFVDMPYLDNMSDTVKILPRQYQYLLALFASSRCYDTDERFYEGTEKRNEFESLFLDLISEIEAGNVIVFDDAGDEIDDHPNYIDYVTDQYFNISVGGDVIDTSVS